jgi:hypothetical protein
MEIYISIFYFWVGRHPKRYKKTVLETLDSNRLKNRMTKRYFRNGALHRTPYAYQTEYIV